MLEPEVSVEPVEAPSDELLLDLCRSGQLDPAGALYDRHSRGLYAYARLHVRDAGESEDIVQEAFLRLFKQVPVRAPASVRAFLYASADFLLPHRLCG